MHRVIYFYEYTCKNYQQCAIEGVFIFKSVWGSIYFHPMQCVYQTIHVHHHQLKLSDCRRLPVSLIRAVDDSLHWEVYGSRICDIWSWWLPSWVTWGVAITIYFFLLTVLPIPEVNFWLHTTSWIWSKNWKGFTSCVRDLCGPDLYIKLTNQSNCHVPIKDLTIGMDLA